VGLKEAGRVPRELAMLEFFHPKRHFRLITALLPFAAPFDTPENSRDLQMVPRTLPDGGSGGRRIGHLRKRTSTQDEQVEKTGAAQRIEPDLAQSGIRSQRRFPPGSPPRAPAQLDFSFLQF
jgi:hypothetical protein